MAVITKQQSMSSHWYTPNGRAAHKQPKANGDGDRSTTIRDARKLKLLPSVTNVLGVLSKGGLLNWQLHQVGLAAHANRPTEGESADYYAKRMVAKSKESTDEAADMGSKIHKAIEDFYDGNEVAENMMPFVQPITTWQESKGLRFIEREVILANVERGYAGMCDVVGLGADNQMFIIDWKTRKTDPKKKIKSYETEVLQVAAYAATRWGEQAIMDRKVHGANVYVSRNEVGRVEVRAWKPEEIFGAYQTFLNCCHIWRYVKGYDPRS